MTAPEQQGPDWFVITNQGVREARYLVQERGEPPAVERLVEFKTNKGWSKPKWVGAGRMFRREEPATVVWQLARHRYLTSEFPKPSIETMAEDIGINWDRGE